jgi:2-phospho-L-lactate guanylyltransferase
MSGQAFSIETKNMLLRGRRVADRDDGLWALVPVKALTDAKQRLKDCLGEDREGFTVAMLQDVLAALIDSKEVSQVVVVTADDRVAAIAEQAGLLVIDENGSKGMNAAIDLGVEAIRNRGGQRVVILPADIPLMTAAEFDRVAADFEHQGRIEGNDFIGINPSTYRGGTNCIFLNTQQAFTFHYGPDSFSLHRDCAKRHRHRPISLYSPTISLDIDEERDLDALLAFCVRNPEFKETQTWKFLLNTGRTS